MFMFFAFLLGGLGVAAVASGGSSGGSRSGSDTPVAAEPEAEPAVADDPEPDSAPIVAAPLIVADEPSDGGAGDDGDAPAPAPGGRGEPDIPDLANSAFDIGWAGLSGEEQMIVELVNRARLDPQAEVDRLNEELASGISSSPVEALAVVPTLSDAAEAHSEDMDNRDYFSHTDPEGGQPWDRAVEEGHSTTFVGENIGWIGSTRTSFDEQARAEAHHENLWESDGHQRNLMSDNWSEIGLGYDYGSYRGYDGSTFVTELFSDTGKSYLTGVVIEDEDGDDFYDIGEGLGDVQITAFDGDEAYATATWEAGGYSLALPPGTYRVKFEGGGLDEPFETEVVIGNDNVKLDVIEDGGTAVMSLNATPVAPEPEIADVMALVFSDTAVVDETPLTEADEEEELLLI